MCQPVEANQLQSGWTCCVFDSSSTLPNLASRPWHTTFPLSVTLTESAIGVFFRDCIQKSTRNELRTFHYSPGRQQQTPDYRQTTSRIMHFKLERNKRKRRIWELYLNHHHDSLHWTKDSWVCALHCRQYLLLILTSACWWWPVAETLVRRCWMQWRDHRERWKMEKDVRIRSTIAIAFFFF